MDTVVEHLSADWIFLLLCFRYSFGLGKRSPPTFPEPPPHLYHYLGPHFLEAAYRQMEDEMEMENRGYGSSFFSSSLYLCSSPCPCSWSSLCPPRQHCHLFYIHSENQSVRYGLGKREGYGFGLGKRSSYGFGLGKRSSYGFGLGKRSGSYGFGLGKRSDNPDTKRSSYGFGLGKWALRRRRIVKKCCCWGPGKKRDN